ncbi:MAG: acyl-CoA dehydrogenase [Propionicimonas sp.]|uniref:acyl-CoA dehydrogenase family protein n=1 Tax=Propionicimonas sp. TaxID=1955623 RepID=UPI003D1034D1
MTQVLDASTTSAPDTSPSPGLGAALCTALDGPLADRRAQARAAFPSEHLLRDPDQGIDEARDWVLNRLTELSDAGFGSAGVPRNADDVADPAAAVITFEMLAHGDLSTLIKSGVQWGLFGGAVTNLGTRWHHDTFLPDITSMKLLGCYAMTELGHGSDVSGLETTITYIPETDEYEVRSETPEATKAYIGNAARDGEMAVVFGQLLVRGKNHGVHAVLVPIRDEDGADLPGVTSFDHGGKGGLLGVDNGMLRFDRVRVPREMLLDRYGGVDAEGRYSSPIDNPNRRFFTMLGTLVRGRVCIAAGGGVAARRALSIATRYALKRRQFAAPGHPDGVVLMDYLIHQRRLLPGIARAYALGFAQNELTAALVHIQGGGAHTEREQRQLETMAAGLKATATRFANDTIQECREACGGAGYMAENRLVGLRADADVFATFEGDNTVLLQLVAKALLTDYKQVWGDLDRVGMVQATARMVGGTMLERTAANLLVDRLVATARRRPDELALVDRGWHAYLFEERERHALESLARRMRRASSKDFDAVNRLGDHMLFVAKAHLERVLLEAFIAGIEACTDPAAKAVLQRLCSLYALSSINDDRAWFIEHNRITTGRAKAIGAQLSALCGELRPDALALVEGLGIPESWLGATFLE